MKNIKNNLNNRICDCEKNSNNTQTYLEFIIEGYKQLNCPLTEREIERMKNKEVTNFELENMIEELEWLLCK